MFEIGPDHGRINQKNQKVKADGQSEYRNLKRKIKQSNTNQKVLHQEPQRTL